MWWFNGVWYQFRMWLAQTIFPEIVMHIKVTERLAVIDENLRIVDLLEKSDSACAEWAINLVETKYRSINDLIDSVENKDG